MQFDDEHHFNQPASTVIKMFSDKNYFVRKYEELGFGNVEVLDHSMDGSQFSITCRYEAPSDAPIPGFAKKFMGQTNVVTQTDRWDTGTMTGELTAEIEGLPATVSAEMELVDDGDGSTNTLSWTIKCGIPLDGGKIEKLVAEDIRAKSGADVAKSSEILADY